MHHMKMIHVAKTSNPNIRVFIIIVIKHMSQFMETILEKSWTKSLSTAIIQNIPDIFFF